MQALCLNPRSLSARKCVWRQWDVYQKIAREKIGGITASGMELSINNAAEAAVNAPFNSTGLQTTTQLFFLKCWCSMSGSYLRLYGFVWFLCQVFPLTSIAIAEPLMGFHQWLLLMEFPTLLTLSDPDSALLQQQRNNVHIKSKYMSSI